jgi:hypothetical protein
MVPQPQQTEGSALAYRPDPAAAVPAPSPGAEPREPLMTRDAARYLGMSESWLRQSRMAGRMSQPPPYHMITGWAVRYYRHELDSWLVHRVPSGDQRKPAPAIETEAPEPARVSTKVRPARKARARPPRRSTGGRRRSR